MRLPAQSSAVIRNSWRREVVSSGQAAGVLPSLDCMPNTGPCVGQHWLCPDTCSCGCVSNKGICTGCGGTHPALVYSQ
jgi:hypothetical protein